MMRIHVTTAVLACVCAATPSRAQTSGAMQPAAVTSSSKVVFNGPLAPKDGAHLTVQVVEVVYPPGAASKPHQHPCGVIGYIVSGQLRMQLKGGPEHIYRVGDTFYESPTDVHMVSTNDSKTESAKLIAYFTCDHDMPLSIPAPPGA